TSLENALKKGRLSHAYLFSGPRGVGKTSTARILAYRVNQVSPAAANTQLDIIEIDAASNRRIDEIRDLREKVHLAPSQGQYKIYIIDEVHMLTPEAFNALLKTLEEPPAHVIFVLATTEPHKLPETIISRTQRYSFRPVEAPLLIPHLRKIAKAEAIKIDDDALELIALAAEGSVRDGLSILDQAANVGGKTISASGLRGLLGLSDQSVVEELALALAKQQPQQLLEIFDSYRAQGGAAGQLLGQLLQLGRQLIRCQLGLSNPRSPAERELTELIPLKSVTAIVKRLIAVPANSPYLEIALESALVQLATAQTPAEVAVQPKPANQPVIIASAPVEPVSKPLAKTTAKAATKPATSSDFETTAWPKVLTLVKAGNNSL
ncbi:MAG TPA: DNA polymerase III subunit gamma/tau, partial [Candidatus Babeliales bacterium]|nr:DNA polymerase III subunit gamma/tau [Candidatus Babeliales bacterium]